MANATATVQVPAVIKDRWREEALQMRSNHDKLAAIMNDFADLFERSLPARKTTITPELALTCLAFHHLAMYVRSSGRKRTVQCMYNARLEDLPKSYGFEGRVLPRPKAAL